jgi:hypothetical protein
MATGKYSVYNSSREGYLSSGVTVIDTTLEPLRVLKVMIEGLALNAETGLWLTPLDGIPKVPRLSPFDLVYLDVDRRVVHGAELQAGVDFPPFGGQASSALVLPFKTVSSSQTRSGDQLILQVVDESSPEPNTAAITDEPRSQVAELAAEHFEWPRGEVQATEEETQGETQNQEDDQDDDESVISKALQWAQERTPTPLAPAPSSSGPSIAKDTESPIERTPLINGAGASHKMDSSRPGRAAIQELDEKGKTAYVALRAEDLLKASLKRIAEETECRPERTPIGADPFTAQPRPRSSAEQISKREVASKPGDNRKLRQVETQRLIQKEPAKDKVEPQASELESVVTRALRWLYPDAIPLPNRRGALRCPMSELVAYVWSVGDPQAHEIGDISSTGIYLVTKSRWTRGELVSMTLQWKGPLEESSERRVMIKAEAVRWGDAGIGLRFVLPTGMDLRLWESPLKTGEVRGSAYVLHEVRIARALSFVRRICPTVGEGVGHLVQKSLSSYRRASAVDIALKAEELLSLEPDPGPLLAHPAIVLRILEVGSWADVEFIRKLWAGLLVASCSAEGNDESNLAIADTLSVLTPIHVRILTEACAKATRAASERGSISSGGLYCSAEEMREITGIHDLIKIHRSVAQLSDLGLFEKGDRPSFLLDNDRINTTPTHLGLQIYARCSGRRGDL